MILELLIHFRKLLFIFSCHSFVQLLHHLIMLSLFFFFIFKELFMRRELVVMFIKLILMVSELILELFFFRYLDFQLIFMVIDLVYVGFKLTL